MPVTSQQTSVLERFLRYARLDTTSDHASPTVPSTAKQLKLLDLLVDELKTLGLKDTERDKVGIVMATLPATSTRKNLPVTDFCARGHASPEMSGTGVGSCTATTTDAIWCCPTTRPRCCPPEDPISRASAARDIVTGRHHAAGRRRQAAAGRMAAVEHLVKYPAILHGPLRISFTPDEEIGRGVRHFDVKRFGARAYTLDGGLGTLSRRSAPTRWWSRSRVGTRTPGSPMV
jgi:tripeptide aminopeptidase